MVALHNPTHIETLPEGRAHSEGAENRLDGITRKNGRKKDGLGVFAKLLAGLISKKPLRQGTIDPNGAGSGTKKTGFPNVTETKGARNPAIRENKQKDTAQGFEGLSDLNFEFTRLFPADVKENQDFTFELLSQKLDTSRQTKETERRLSAKKGEIPNAAQEELQNVSLQPKSTKQEKSLQMEGDAKKAGKKRNSVSLEVHDLRTSSGAEAGTIAERGLKAAEELRNSSEKEIIVELRPERGQNEHPFEAGQKTPAGESFEQILARELQGDLSANIVRQAAIVLRDGGEGTIRLALKPETLGKVKIHLEMAENKISGLIFVENEEALRAFEQEIHTLEQSFRDSGFEASLNAALDYQEKGQRWKEKEVKPFFSERFAVSAASYEESSAVGFTGELYTGFGVNAVNVLA